MEKFKLSVHHARNPLYGYCRLVEAVMERRAGLFAQSFL